jgi:hypothetical protein
MSATYQIIGQALFDLLDALDIAAIYPGGWGQKANYPIKQLYAPFPAFSVQPVEDAEVSLDNVSNNHTTTYALYLYESFQDSPEAEGKMRRLVDLVRTQLRTQWLDTTPLNNGIYAITELSGAWGFDIDLGLRFYRFQVTTQTSEDTL